MANEILYNYGTPIVWADMDGDFPAAGAGTAGLTATHNITLLALADGAAASGVKADLTDTRARQFIVYAGLEFQVAPTAGEIVEFYWAGSLIDTAGSANPGMVLGTDDATYTGTTGSTLAESVLQLQFIGSLVCTNDAKDVVQYQQIGILTDIPRYGMPVVKNESGQALNTTDDIEMFVALIPLVDEVQ